MGRLHSRRWLLAVALLVGVSAGARFASARTFTVPWIAPDEMLYALIGRSLWLHGTLTVRNAATPYYSLLYPALIGAPLLLRDTRRSVEVIQALQTLVVSLTAVPVYLWARRLMGRGTAFAAATLTLLVPTLAYSGLMMSEVLFYPLAVVSSFDGRLRMILEQLGLSQYFSHIFVSSELGVDKPDPEIFRRALKFVRLDARDVLHVGDDPERDWQAANEAGLFVFQLDRPRNSLRDLLSLL